MDHFKVNVVGPLVLFQAMEGLLRASFPDEEGQDKEESKIKGRAKEKNTRKRMRKKKRKADSSSYPLPPDPQANLSHSKSVPTKYPKRR